MTAVALIVAALIIEHGLGRVAKALASLNAAQDVSVGYSTKTQPQGAPQQPSARQG